MAKKETFDGSSFSICQIIESANSYYELSAVYTSQIPTALDSPAGRPDLTVASATNRILALELYLKASLIRTGIPVPFDHDLKVLFDALPEQMRKNVKTLYDREIAQSASLSGSASTSYYFQLGPEITLGKGTHKTNLVRIDPSLSGLLVRNRKGFVLSRYLFQEAKFDRHTHFLYEHFNLAVLCKIFCENLEALMPKDQPYLRHFEF